MKRCSICKEEKANEEFSKNRTKKDGLNDLCRECSKARCRRYYADNRVAHGKVTSERKKRVIQENRERILEVLARGCADCSTKDLRVLEFDHRDPAEKTGGISHLLARGCSWETIQKEIEKCDVVCANCHRIRTYEQFPSYRTRCLTV